MNCTCTAMDLDTIAEIGHFDSCPLARSPCCDAPLEVAGGNTDGALGWIRWYVCGKCKKA